QAPIAPARPPVEARAQDEATLLELDEQRLVITRPARERCGGVRDRPEGLEPPAEDLDQGESRAQDLGREPTAIVEDDASRGSQLVEPARPGPRLALGDEPHPEQGLVDLVGLTGLGPRLLADAADRLGVEGPELVGGPLIERPPVLDRLG